MTNPIPGTDLVKACQNLIDYLDERPPMGESLWCVQEIRSALAAAKVGANVAADIPTWQMRRDEDIKLNGEAQANPLAYAAYEIADLRTRLAAGAPAETPKPGEMPGLPSAYSYSVGGLGLYTAEQMNFFRDNCVRVALENAAQPAPIAGDVEKDAWVKTKEGLPIPASYARMLYEGWKAQSGITATFDEFVGKYGYFLSLDSIGACWGHYKGGPAIRAAMLANSSSGEAG